MERNTDHREAFTVHADHDAETAHLRMLNYLGQVESRQNRAAVRANNRFKIG